MNQLAVMNSQKLRVEHSDYTLRWVMFYLLSTHNQ